MPGPVSGINGRSLLTYGVRAVIIIDDDDNIQFLKYMYKHDFVACNPRKGELGIWRGGKLTDDLLILKPDLDRIVSGKRNSAESPFACTNFFSFLDFSR